MRDSMEDQDCLKRRWRRAVLAGVSAPLKRGVKEVGEEVAAPSEVRPAPLRPGVAFLVTRRFFAGRGWSEGSVSSRGLKM